MRRGKPAYETLYGLSEELKRKKEGQAAKLAQDEEQKLQKDKKKNFNKESGAH